MNHQKRNSDLTDFMKMITASMESEYNRIQKRSTEDQGTAGDQGEENWASLLKDWLPADYQVVTKGRLLGRQGDASPQVDIIILYPFYPKHLLDKKLYLTAGVAAAFECKNTLKSCHIKKSIENSVKIKKIARENDNPHKTYHNEIYGKIIYGLLAHSHSWKAQKSTPIENIENTILKWDTAYVKHPTECLDFVCISDLATWYSVKSPMGLENYNKGDTSEEKWQPGPITGFAKSEKSSHKEGSDLKENFTPIGVFLPKLFKKMALNDTRLIEFSRYFEKAIGGVANIKWRKWKESILSIAAQEDLKKNQKEYENSWKKEW